MPESPVIFSKKKEFCFRVQYKTLWPTARLGIVRAEGVKAIEYLWSFLFETIGWLSLLWVMMRNSLFLAPCWPKKESIWFVWRKLFPKKGKNEFVWAQPTGKNTANFLRKVKSKKWRKISEKWNNQKITTTSLLKRAEIRTADSSRQGKRSYLRQFKRIKRNVVQKCWRKVANNRLRNSMKIGRKEKEFFCLCLPVKSYVPTSNCLLTRDNKLKITNSRVHTLKEIHKSKIKCKH